MILLSLASKQIWPQVLAVCHLKPASLVLLHSEDDNESRKPAERLKKFFKNQGTLGRGCVGAELLSDSDFSAIEKRLDELAASQQWNLGDCVLNITGGNKLMATAAFRWAARRGVRTFYLERRNGITWFDFRDGETMTTSEQADGHLADSLDPVALLRCQMDSSEVEREGESLTLNSEGIRLPDEELFKHLQNGVDATRFLTTQGIADVDAKKGDGLELATAAVLLKLGVQKVQRSLRLKVKSAQGVSTRQPHAEIDLLFSWGGKLWLVDCKDRKDPESLIEGLRRELNNQALSPQATELLARISKELSIGQTKVMKEDLLAVRETGGLLGQIVCVRKALLSEEVHQFARHNQIEVVQKSELAERWRSLLFPNHPPDQAQLASLVKAFGA